jgi:rubrerythrin
MEMIAVADMYECGAAAMGIELDANDVFEMAEQIERDAAAFYMRASSASRDPRTQRVLLGLATMEAEHEQIFDTMKTHLSAEGWTAAGVERAAGLAGDSSIVAGLFASGVGEDLAERFTGGQTAEQILRKAIEFEKDTIVFFVSMRDMLRRAADRKRIDGIIKEELGHILMLTSELASVSS